MKKELSLLLALVLLGLGGCRSFDPALLQPDKTALSVKMPAMDSRVENYGLQLFIYAQDVGAIFEREVRQNLTDPYTEKKGSIVMKLNITENRAQMGYAFFSGFFFFVPNLFGMPMYGIITSLEVQLDVLDANRQLIGSYTGAGKRRTAQGIFSKGPKYRDFVRVNFIYAFKDALNMAREALAQDIPRLNERLK